MKRLESPLMKAPDRWLSCSCCWYHSENYCARRERTARWNPFNFVCGDFGLSDDAPDPPRGQSSLIDFGVTL